jgi:hypothetical protein
MIILVSPLWTLVWLHQIYFNSQQAWTNGLVIVGCSYQKLDFESLVNVKDALGITIVYGNDTLNSQFQDMVNKKET